MALGAIVSWLNRLTTKVVVDTGDGQTQKANLVAMAQGATLDVAVQDQTSSPLEWLLSRKLTTTNLVANIPVTDEGAFYQVTPTFTVEVASASKATPDATGNMWLEIWEGSLQYQGEIQGVAGNNLTLGVPIAFPFTTNAVVYIVDVNQNRNFTNIGIDPIGNKEYTFSPAPTATTDWHINRFIITMLHLEASDSSLYGDLAKLPLGVFFCGTGTRFPEETGLDKNIKLQNCLFNMARNQDYKSIAYDVQYEPKSGNPAAGTFFGTSIRKSFNGQDKSGVVIPSQRDRDEVTTAVFRDNLSTLKEHRIRVIGHAVD